MMALALSHTIPRLQRSEPRWLFPGPMAKAITFRAFGAGKPGSTRRLNRWAIIITLAERINESANRIDDC